MCEIVGQFSAVSQTIVRIESYHCIKEYNTVMRVEKKIWKEYFDKVASGDKNFELRLSSYWL
ncbi:hypothetical protein COT50_01290 [candidate division WWE3 bacterium CG08_land_8_20_14_0_20_41_10]|uniref:Uncharacterized protein n=1 Tax=candidate division WWE3 bacterium CG08_land_8_20_14_0_20_41_10 TaxID=1975085 RepID=A0A2H0XCB4_UNCKA|nr:MAG: hypothetical protein COT50_01290 [candidate division WWE3 bacterium CG08_land_8_20_14_0_20_41_10]